MEKPEELEIPESKLSMSEQILEYVKDNPDCRVSDLYRRFPRWDQGHIRTKVRRLVETHRIVQRLRVEKDYNPIQ